jgi:hypothetical protein
MLIEIEGFGQETDGGESDRKRASLDETRGKEMID